MMMAVMDSMYVSEKCKFYVLKVHFIVFLSSNFKINTTMTSNRDWTVTLIAPTKNNNWH